MLICYNNYIFTHELLSVPRLKPETIRQKIAVLNTQIAQLDKAIDKLENHKRKPLQNRYLSKCPAGGSAFAGNEEKQAEHSYWVLYQSNPRKRIRNVNKRDVASVRAQVKAGKQLTKLCKQLDKMTGERDYWQQKL